MQRWTHGRAARAVCEQHGGPIGAEPCGAGDRLKLPVSTDPCGRVVYGLARDADELQGVGKVDVQLSKNQSFFGRYIATTYVSDPPFMKSENILTTTLGGRDNLAQSFTGGHTMILSSDTVNSMRFAFNRTSVHRTNADTFSAPTSASTSTAICRSMR